MLRSYYLQQIKKDLNLPLIKVVVGLRRIGKTTLLQQIQQTFTRKNPININFELLEFEHLLEYHTLNDFLEKKIQGGSNALFLDEIQRVNSREKTINSLNTAHPEVQIFITGSNGSLLSGELATYLRGRYLEYYVNPFTYTEYCEFYQKSKGYESFGDFLQEGGFPLLYQFPNIQRETNFQRMLDTIFMRDIIQRHQIRDIVLLKELLLFLFQNSGNITNASKLTEYLVERKLITNYNTIDQYLGYLEDAFLIASVPLYDIQGKKLFNRLKKYYPVDHSCINFSRSGFDVGAGKQLETYLFTSANTYGWSGYVGRNADKEIDFVFEKGKKKLFVQGTYLLSSEEVIQREFGSLLEIQNNYKKYVVSLDPYPQPEREGIEHIPARKWEDLIK